MGGSNFVFFVPTLLAVFVCSGIALYAWRQQVPGARPFAVLMLAAAEWSLCSALGFISTERATAEFWAHAQYLGFVTAPAAWLALALEYGGNAHWLTRRTLALLALMPVVTLALVITNQYHGLIIADFDIDPTEMHAVEEPGLWYWVVDAYSYGLLLLGAGTLLPLFRRSGTIYRWQITTMVIGAALPWVLDLLADTGLTPFPRDVNMTAVGFIFTGGLFTWGLFRFRLLDLAPVARGAIIENLSEGVIVLDTQDRIVDLNPAGRAMLGRTDNTPIGQPLAVAWPPVRVLLDPPPPAVPRAEESFTADDATPEDKSRCEIALPPEAPTVFYEALIQSWTHDGRPAGRVVIVRNITRRKQAEQAILRRNGELAALNRLGQSLSRLTEPTELVDLILATIGQVINNRNLYIALYDEVTQSISFPLYVVNGERIARESRPMVHGLTEHVIRTGMSLFLPRNLENATNELGIERQHRPAACYLGVPMLAGERVIGVIAVQDYEHEDAFDWGHVAMLTTIASQATVALENARLFAETRRRAEQLQAINDVEYVLTTTMQPEVLATEIVHVLSSRLNIRHVALGLIDGDEIVFRVTDNEDEDEAVLRPLLSLPRGGESITAQAAALGKTTVVHDTQLEPRFQPFADWPHTRSEVAVPLKTQAGVIGVLNFESDEVNAFAPELVALVETVAGQIAIAVENARLFAETQRLSVTDTLTGVSNRRQLFEIGAREISRARRLGQPLSAIMVDIDHFKRVNDTYGHAVGDQVLQDMARTCQRHVRDSDIIARYGGEEFAILLVDTDRHGACRSAERLRAHVEHMVTDTPQGPLRITLSAGVAEVRADSDLAEALNRADQMLYAAKQSGRNCVRAE
ncbi:MAG: diguanylate cyclase [Chloroflexi bacterium]|nr:diguanylate cyclase [Chloroflexota bacterium]